MMKRYVVLLFLAGYALLLSGCRKAGRADVRVPVLMKKYAIEPAIIKVKSGQTVELDVTTADIQHGLDIPDLNIKEPVQPGKTTTIIFTAPAKGEYRITCGVICGPHHDDMTGKLVVE